MRNLLSTGFLVVLFFVLLPFAGCKKEDEKTTLLETGSVTDIDGNVYKTVKIGNKWWMAENLKTTRFQNGFAIASVQSSGSWLNAPAAYCLYDNNPSAPGLLYNFAAVSDTSKLAPMGWHIATETDWQEMEKYLGMADAELNSTGWRGDNIGDKLRVASPQGWTKSGTVWSTNTSGFSALAGACRLNDGTWADPGLFATGFWWTSSSSDNNTAYYRYLDYKKTSVFRGVLNQGYGCSVRCVKD